MNEAEYDMKNKGDRGGCYLDYGDLPNSSYPKKAELIILIALLFIQNNS